MPFETQAKILRSLQDQTFLRVGGTTPVRVDVRFVSSTAKNLTQLIKDGRFREDLYYRLKVVPIEVPALKDRREDIPLLAEHLMAQAARRSGQPPRRLGADAVACLQSYEWPGNVRQLGNVMDWVLIMAPAEEGAVVSAAQLPPELQGIDANLPKADRSAEIMALPLRDARETFEREYLVAQLARFGGNISRTAAFVGMERSALHRKLRLLGVVAEPERGGEARTRPFDA
jgi:two-component system nitrogen regulation response regulator NtrX